LPGVVLYHPGPGGDGWKMNHRILGPGESLNFHSSSESAEFSFLYAFVLDNVMTGAGRSTNVGEFILTVNEK
jgi:hypothetical protein